MINNNSGFGQGWPNIQRQQGNKPGDVRDLVRFGPTNFADVARVFGLRGIRVEDPSQIAPALKDALASDETVIVDVATDIDAAHRNPGCQKRQDDGIWHDGIRQTPPPLAGGGRGRGPRERGSGCRRTLPPNPLPQGEGEELK